MMVDTSFWKAAIRTGSVALLALAVGAAVPDGSTVDPSVSPVVRALRTLFIRDLTREADDDEVAGYYEGLMAGRPRELLGRARQPDRYRFRNDFLYYENKPGLASSDSEDALVTNRLSMADVEYAFERAPNTWRVAVIGDSVTRGQGAPFGESFEALLERKLNEVHRTPEIDQFELLNFCTTGYRLTQMVDVALEKAPAFRPDVYVLALTRLSVGARWGDHLIQLVYEGIDLKYDFLKQLAVETGLDPRQPPATLRTRLAPKRLQAIGWAVEEVRQRARAEGASLIVLLVPTANRPASLEPAFAGIPGVLEELKVPYINLLDAFRDVPTLDGFRVSEGNVHPNGVGHRRLFEHLYRILRTDASAAEALLGPAASKVNESGAGAR